MRNIKSLYVRILSSALAILASLLLFAPSAFAGNISNEAVEYDYGNTLPESATTLLVASESPDVPDRNIVPFATERGSGGIAKIDRVYGDVVRWEAIPNGPANYSFHFMGTVTVEKYSSGKYKFHSAHQATGDGLYFTGCSEQIDLGLSSGSYRVTLYGTAFGFGGVQVTLPYVSIGFSI